MVFCTVVIFRGTGGASKLSAFRLRENFMKVHGLTGHRILRTKKVREVVRSVLEVKIEF